MELIAKGTFCITTDSAFLYYIKRDSHNHHERFYKTDLDLIIEVSVEDYVEGKFGHARKAIHSIYTECVRLTNGEYLTCSFESSIVYRHNREGKKIHQYNIAPLQTGFDTIYSITVDKLGHLWLAQPSSHMIAQYDLNTEEEMFKIGGDFNNPDIFNYPEQIRAYGDYIYISDMGNNRVCKLNIDSKELSEYLTLEEPVLEYVQYKEKELVQVQSGLYVI